MNSYENSLFKTANKLRGKIPPSDYKFYVLPLVFIRYLSEKNKNGAWEKIVQNCGELNNADIIDEELSRIIPVLDKVKNPFEDIFRNSALATNTIKDLVLLIDEIDIKNKDGKVDYLGRIYEYFISNFAATEGNRGGEYFTPSTVVELLVQMLDPQSGLVFDPACGTGGMFVQSSKFSNKKLKFFGQEQNSKTVMLAYMNGILHGLDVKIKNGDTLLNDMYPDLKADFIISNPPFNMKDWGAEEVDMNDPRIFGMVNKNNANYMWIQHFIYHLNDTGRAGFVISNGALTSSNEADLITRKKMLENNMIDCVVQLPEKMFFGTSIPSALIFLDMDRKDNDNILFIDASLLGKNISKTQKILRAEDIDEISNLYHGYRRGDKKEFNNKGFSCIISRNQVLTAGCKLTPSFYTGVKEIVVDMKENEKKITELKQKLIEQIRINALLTEAIVEVLDK